MAGELTTARAGVDAATQISNIVNQLGGGTGPATSGLGALSGLLRLIGGAHSGDPMEALKGGASTASGAYDVANALGVVPSVSSTVSDIAGPAVSSIMPYLGAIIAAANAGAGAAQGQNPTQGLLQAGMGTLLTSMGSGAVAAALPFQAAVLGLNIADMLGAKEAQPTKSDIQFVGDRVGALKGLGEIGKQAASSNDPSIGERYIKMLTEYHPEFNQPAYQVNNPFALWQGPEGDKARYASYENLGTGISNVLQMLAKNDPEALRRLFGDPRAVGLGSMGEMGNWGFAPGSQGGVFNSYTEGDYNPTKGGSLFQIQDPQQAAISNVLAPILNTYFQSAGPGQGELQPTTAFSNTFNQGPRKLTAEQIAGTGAPDFLVPWLAQATDPQSIYLADQFGIQQATNPGGPASGGG
jgi:hypothetical protein